MGIALLLALGCAGGQQSCMGGGGGSAKRITLSAPGVVRDGNKVVISWDAKEHTGKQQVFLQGTNTVVAKSSKAQRVGDLALKIADVDDGVSTATFNLPLSSEASIRVAVGNATSKIVKVPPLKDRAVIPEGTVRDVYMLSPTHLVVVVTQVDGESIPKVASVKSTKGVRKIKNRFLETIPVAQPDFEVGYGARNNIQKVLVDHRLIVELDTPVSSSEVFEISLEDMTLGWVFDDRQSPTPLVQVNQVAYLPGATERWAYLSAWMGTGGPLALGDLVGKEVDVLDAAGMVIASYPIELRSSLDVESGTPVAQVNLASLPQGGPYRISVRGVGVSPETAVGDGRIVDAYKTVARGLFHNRFQHALEKPYTKFTRPVDHTTVYAGEQSDVFAEFSESSSKDKTFPMRGGHHDAGDFDIRPMHTVVPQLLMRAFELGQLGKSQPFEDGELNLPESGNKIPDLLDEALWNLRGWEALQNKDGGVRGGVNSHRDPDGVFFASDDRLPYWTYSADPNVTARVVATFAQMSRLLRPYNKKRSDELKERALRGYKWLKKHEAKAPFLLYANSELYALTGDASYQKAGRKLFMSFGTEGVYNVLSITQLALQDYREGERVMPDYYLSLLRDLPEDSKEKNLTGRYIGTFVKELLRRANDKARAFRSVRPNNSDFGWGQTVIMGRYLEPVYAQLMLGTNSAEERQRLVNLVSIAADNLFGCNPMGMVWISGLGTRSPRRALHLDSLAFSAKGNGPIPGIPVFGPASELPDAAWMEPARRAFTPKYKERPPLRRYADVRTSVINNEFTIWEAMAPHTQHLALLRVLLDRDSVPVRTGNGTTTP